MTQRIAILLTNDDESAFAQAFADDGQKVAQLLQPLRPDWQFNIVRVIDGELPPSVDAFDAHVITGSPASVNDDTLPWVRGLLDFIRALHAAQRLTIGLCFGHQAIARALGGQVERHAAGWSLGLHTTRWSQPQAWMQPARSQMTLMAAHNEQVTQPPPGAQVLSGSDFCRIGSFSVGRHIFTTQYHPEMSPRFMHALLSHLDALAACGKVIDAATVQAARQSLASIDGAQHGPITDAQVLAQWMVQFLEPAA